MSAALVTQQKLCGLFELDATGTVLYSRIERDENSNGAESDLMGRNFFTEIAPFKNTEEFQQHLDSFRRSASHASSINFTCQYDDGPPVPVRILVARIREQLHQEQTKSILLVHIRNAH